MTEYLQGLFVGCSIVVTMGIIIYGTYRYSHCEMCGKKDCECRLTAQVVDALYD